MTDAKPKELCSKEDLSCLLAHKRGVFASLHYSVEVTGIIASSASSHMTSHRSLSLPFSSTVPFSVQMNDRSQVELRGQGSFEPQVKLDGELRTCVLKDDQVLCSPHYSLILGGYLCKNGFKVLFLEKQVVICDKDKSVTKSFHSGSVRAQHGNAGTCTLCESRT